MALHPLVFMSDFGWKERFVASMKGVALQVDPEIRIFDITHEIKPFDVWSAGQVLAGTLPYWPKGTVFVSVVDPGVGTQRSSLVAETESGHYVVSPDNGTFTFIEEQVGIREAREIDERKHRLSASKQSHTFHGRDIYAYTGAKLAAGKISFKKVGTVVKRPLEKLPYQPARFLQGFIEGLVMKIEQPFGNVVTNIPDEFLLDLTTDKQQPLVKVEIIHRGQLIFAEEIPFVKSYGYVPLNAPLLYIDSVYQVGIALNQGDFAQTYAIKPGADWLIRLQV
ncbi:S-adenosyl-l-methionine hydroxide adenosyltransferase family protein [Rapidithrix thailandica]|uniref:S-adenosyl-l-methionine hydroxide adenosyltransferase family protein n=1 Tax=Rapidithrix thailandica TaxID=413964 RepID=A0AAW9RZA5_9BACT